MLRAVILLLLTAPAAYGTDFTPRELNIYLSGGKSMLNVHGNSTFRTIHFEIVGRSAFLNHWIPKVDAGTSLSYSDISQPRSFFRQRGEPDDRVHALASFLFVRRQWRESTETQPYLEIGSGPMWSNREVPATTAHLNFSSSLGFGAILFSQSRVPLRVGYRFSHISNGIGHERNPGLNVHLAVVGIRVMKLRSP